MTGVDAGTGRPQPEQPPGEPPADQPPSRRSFLQLAGAGAAVAVGASVPVTRSGAQDRPTPDEPTAPAAVAATGAHQAGVGRPATPPSHLLLAVFDLEPGVRVAPLLARLGTEIRAVAAGRSGAMLGMPPGDVTVTVGVGPRLVRAVDPALPGAQGLPEFPREQIPEANRGGDLLVQVCASDPVVCGLALSAVTGAAGGLSERWRQDGARGAPVPLPDGRSATRNGLGFIDGIIAPDGPADTAPEVWIPAPARVQGGSVVVVRLMAVDVPAFAARTVSAQEAVIGRRRDSGVPLSGRNVLDPPDLGAVTADGRYVVPLHSHVRRTHAAATGVPRMLRRSYSTSTPAGLLFISFQRDLHTFVATMNRMQTGDDLFELTTTTATGSFLVLPGFDDSRPLGATLFG